MHIFAISEGATAGLWPFIVLLICVALIVILIAVLKVHAFIALILTALTAGILSPVGQLPGEIVDGEVVRSHWVQAIELTTIEFGKAAGNVALVIALASIIGACLMESGAADKIVRRFLAVFGEKRAGIAMLVSGFVLSIPVFFDTVFFLLVPLARALALRSGKNYMLYVMAICGGGAITHSIVAPTPGPLIVVEILKLDLGASIVTGFLAGIPPAIGVWFLAKWMNRATPVPLRETPGAPLSELNALIAKRDDELPPFGLAILPVVLPVFMIAMASFLGMARTSYPELYSTLGGDWTFRVFEFLGNKNIALLTGTVIALWLVAAHRGLKIAQLGKVMEEPLVSAGIIILITSAGGAFGGMIRHTGVGTAISTLTDGSGVNYILLAWIVTVVIRVAQGSATVAMITGASMMTAIIDPALLPYHPLYIFLAIGFGSMFLSWMNDSGFWVVCKLSGFTERETFRTWSLLVTAISIMGLLELLILAKVVPLT